MCIRDSLRLADEDLINFRTVQQRLVRPEEQYNTVCQKKRGPGYISIDLLPVADLII